jgi:hypothetical protein
VLIINISNRWNIPPTVSNNKKRSISICSPLVTSGSGISVLDNRKHFKGHCGYLFPISSSLSQPPLASTSEPSAFPFQPHTDIKVGLSNVGEIQKG